MDGELTVVLDCNLTPGAYRRGLPARGGQSKLQTMRKEADFDVTDRILVAIPGGRRSFPPPSKAGKSFIMQSVLAKEVSIILRRIRVIQQQEWDINGKNATLESKKPNQPHRPLGFIVGTVSYRLLLLCKTSRLRFAFKCPQGRTLTYDAFLIDYPERG